MSDPSVLADVLPSLEAMPAELAAAAARMEESTWNVVPSGGGFSLVEQAWHLADLEREGYGERIRRLLAEDDPVLGDFDGARMARERSYRTRSLPDGIAAFAAARAANVALLRAVTPEHWERSGRQEGVGPVALRDIPRMMLEHDAGHREEIAALLAARPRAGEPAWA
jgi:DinB family protein